VVIDMPDEAEARKARAVERAQEILARQPSADELAADEARRQANRLAQIMNPAPVEIVCKDAAPLHFRRQDDALIGRARDPVARVRRDERARAWFDTIDKLMVEKIAPAVRNRQTGLAIQLVLTEMAASAIAAAERADKLEARLAAIEATTSKPRHRVKAISRTI
jgi:hypothetical protein